MKNPALRGAHDHGLCLSKRLARLLAVSGADRFLDRADIGGVTRAALQATLGEGGVDVDESRSCTVWKKGARVVRLRPI